MSALSELALDARFNPRRFQKLLRRDAVQAARIQHFAREWHRAQCAQRLLNGEHTLAPFAFYFALRACADMTARDAFDQMNAQFPRLFLIDLER